MVWNYHDKNDLNVPDSPLNLIIDNNPAEKVMMNHYRVDQEFSNSYSLWKDMESPQDPSPEQIEKLEKAGQLQLLTAPKWLNIKDGKAKIQTQLPRQAVSLIRMAW